MGNLWRASVLLRTTELVSTSYIHQALHCCIAYWYCLAQPQKLEHSFAFVWASQPATSALPAMIARFRKDIGWNRMDQHGSTLRFLLFDIFDVWRSLLGSLAWNPRSKHLHPSKRRNSDRNSRMLVKNFRKVGHLATLCPHTQQPPHQDRLDDLQDLKQRPHRLLERGTVHIVNRG